MNVEQKLTTILEDDSMSEAEIQSDAIANLPESSSRYDALLADPELRVPNVLLLCLFQLIRLLLIAHDIALIICPSIVVPFVYLELFDFG